MAAASVAMAAPELMETADEDGLTPLHMAVIQGNLNLVNLLLANKADVNVLDSEGHSVVHWATGKRGLTYLLCPCPSNSHLILQSVAKSKHCVQC